MELNGLTLKGQSGFVFKKQTLIEHLQCAKYYAKYWGVLFRRRRGRVHPTCHAGRGS